MPNDLSQPPVLSASLVVTDEMRRILSRSETALATVQSFQIDSPEVAQMVAEEMNDIKRRRNKLQEVRDGFVLPAKTILDNARALFNPGLKALEDAEHWCKGLLASWSEKERQRIELETRRRREEEMRQRQEADAKAARERAAAAERAAALQRQADEAEAARKKAIEEGNGRAAAAAAGNAAKLQEQAAAVVQSGEAAAQTHQLVAAAASSLAPIAATTKIEGTTLVDKWGAELLPDLDEDKALRLIVAACATDPRLYGCLSLNLKAINGQATSLRSAMCVPGFVAVNRPYVKGRNK